MLPQQLQKPLELYCSLDVLAGEEYNHAQDRMLERLGKIHEKVYARIAGQVRRDHYGKDLYFIHGVFSPDGQHKIYVAPLPENLLDLNQEAFTALNRQYPLAVFSLRFIGDEKDDPRPKEGYIGLVPF